MDNIDKVFFTIGMFFKILFYMIVAIGAIGFILYQFFFGDKVLAFFGFIGAFVLLPFITPSDQSIALLNHITSDRK